MTYWLDGVLQGGNNVGLTSATETQIDTINTEVIEVEHHLHNKERWLGAAASAATMTALIVSSGTTAGNWGVYVAVSNAADQPYVSGNTKMDFHRAQVSSANDTDPYRVRLAWGASGAAAVAAGNYTEFVVQTEAIGSNSFSGPMDILTPRISTGTTVWASAKHKDAGPKTVSMFFGVHGYTV